MKINRNIAWAESFVRELEVGGVKYACISSGSRNTPLTWAFAQNNNIKKYVIIDERSSAFFALGLANRTGSPVALVCTSGTAAVEFYPAIVEAYQQRIPLIICTADRPPELRNTGTNQSINQDNLYKNHIRYFADAGLPEMSVSKIKSLKKIAVRAIEISRYKNKGPVHINFPFKKPFEPDNHTDKIDTKINTLLLKTIYKPPLPAVDQNLCGTKWFPKIVEKLGHIQRGLIVVGPGRFNEEFHSNVLKLSSVLKYPILADGCSHLRFIPSPGNVINNYEGMFRSTSFVETYMPEIIIHFGRTSISKGLEDFFTKHSPLKIMINENGDFFDPTRKGKAYKCSPSLFCKSIIKHQAGIISARKEDCWFKSFISANKALEELKDKMLFNSAFPNEIRIINELLNAIPENSSVMLSNSLPVRDFDYWASFKSKRINVFNNRGASGIDGITSTGLGIASLKQEPVYLITGDLAYYYDLNALLLAKKYSIPLIIILINNNGGGIFKSLPVSRYPEFLEEYFITPHKLDFEKLTKAFGIEYSKLNSWSDLKTLQQNALSNKETIVIELSTDTNSSLDLRNKYWQESDKLLNSFLDHTSQN